MGQTNLNFFQVIDSLNIGGSERMCVNIANALVKNNFNCTVICTRELGPLKTNLNNKIKLVELGKRNVFDFLAFKKYLKLIPNSPNSILHAHSSSIIWASLVKIIKPRIKLVWHDHFGLSDTLKDGDRKLIQFLSPLIWGGISVNEKLLAWSERNMRFTQSIFIRNFPDLDLIIRKNEIPLILHLANLRPQKDHETLIRAISRLRVLRPELSFNVLCLGVDLFDEYSKKIKQLVLDLGLSNYIKFEKPTNDVAPYLSKASIGVLTSKSEGLPVSLLEYGLAGLPVIITNVGNCAEVVMNGSLGELVYVGDYEEIARKLSILLDFPEKSKVKSELLKKHIIENYGAQKFIAVYLNFINGVPNNS